MVDIFVSFSDLIINHWECIITRMRLIIWNWHEVYKHCVKRMCRFPCIFVNDCLNYHCKHLTSMSLPFNPVPSASLLWRYPTFYKLCYCIWYWIGQCNTFFKNNNSFIYSKIASSVYILQRKALGHRYTIINKTTKIPGFIELTFSWGWLIPKYCKIMSINDKCIEEK